MGKDNYYNLFQYEKKRVKVRKRWIDSDIFFFFLKRGDYIEEKNLSPKPPVAYNSFEDQRGESVVVVYVCV